MAFATCIALLRGINVSGRNKIPMLDLRAICADLGWRDVQSYIQSGNLVFRAPSAPPALERALEGAIAARFGLTIPVIVRAASQWPAYLAGNPFPDAATSAPNHLMLMLSKAPPHADALAQLRARAANGERLEQAGDALWIHYAGGVAESKLSPALFDRLVGSSVTARNWNTVCKIDALTRGEG